MPYVDVNNVRLYYEASGQGIPVVFVHGGFPTLATTLNDFSQWTWTWENDFAELFHFIAYDRRGCYRSSSPVEGYDMENQAFDLAELLNILNVSSAHIIGSSAGGPIAITLAALFPQRVRSLVLAGTCIDFFPLDDPISDLIRQQIETLEQDGPEAAFAQRPANVEVSFDPLWVADEMQARGRYAKFLEREQQLARRVQAMPESERVHYFAVELHAMQAYMKRDDMHDYARQVTSPTLVLHGSDDRMVPLVQGEELVALIPAASMHIVAGGGHSLVHRSMEGRKVVIDFLRSVLP